MRLLRIPLLAALAVTAFAGAGRAQDPPVTREALTREKDRLLARKQALEESSKSRLQDAYSRHEMELLTTARRIRELRELRAFYVRKGLSPREIDEAIKAQEERLQALNKEMTRLRDSISDVDRQVRTIDRRVAEIDRTIGERDRSEFRFAVFVDGGYSSGATFGSFRYNDAARFRDSMQRLVDMGLVTDLKGPEHPLRAGEGGGISDDWTVWYRVARSFRYKTFETQEEAEACARRLEQRGFRARWERVAAR